MVTPVTVHTNCFQITQSVDRFPLEPLLIGFLSRVPQQSWYQYDGACLRWSQNICIELIETL